MRRSLKEVRGHEGTAGSTHHSSSLCLCLILVSVSREVSVVKDSEEETEFRLSQRENTPLDGPEVFPFLSLKH